MKITLLTHQKELERHHNTAHLLNDIPNLQVEVILWHRTEPNLALVQQLQHHQACLIYPATNNNQASLAQIDHLVLLDGTWQEARKMYNRSDYLKSAPWYALENPPKSLFNLRRNQVEGGLCTAECAAELLKLKGKNQQAALVMQKFHNFLNNSR